MARSAARDAGLEPTSRAFRHLPSYPSPQPACRQLDATCCSFGVDPAAAPAPRVRLPAQPAPDRCFVLTGRPAGFWRACFAINESRPSIKSWAENSTEDKGW